MKEKVMNFLKLAKQFILTNKSLVMKMIAVIIVIIAIIVIASSLNGTKVGNAASNSHNLGLAVQDGSWIYYVAVDDDEPVGIYKVKNNGKKTEKVADGYMYNLNIVDNYIYCLEYNEDEERNDLIKIKTNGKNKETLARDIDENQIMLVDKWVYYYKDNSLYRVKTSGTDREKLSDREIEYYQIDGNWIYYIYENEDSQYIAKMKLDGEDSIRIAKADSSMQYEALCIKGGKIYYIASKNNDSYDRDYYLYKMNKKGNNTEQICKIDTNIQYINMQDDAIYYTVTEDYEDSTIKYIKYNGTDKTTIKKTKYATNINVVKDWVIFLGMDDDYNSLMKMISIDGEEEKDL